MSKVPALGVLFAAAAFTTLMNQLLCWFCPPACDVRVNGLEWIVCRTVSKSLTGLLLCGMAIAVGWRRWLSAGLKPSLGADRWLASGVVVGFVVGAVVCAAKGSLLAALGTRNARPADFPTGRRRPQGADTPAFSFSPVPYNHPVWSLLYHSSFTP